MTKLLYPIGLGPKTNQLTIQLYISGFRNHVFRFELMKIHQHPPLTDVVLGYILRMSRKKAHTVNFTAPSSIM